MTTRDAETLTQLVADAAGTRGSGLTYEQLSDRSADPETGYRPSRNLLHRIGTAQDVKMNPSLIRAVAAGLGLPLARVQAAAARQYLGWEAVDPGVSEGSDDEVIRVARRTGVTPRDTRRVGEFVRKSREEDEPDEE
ncbi:hypothetical protein [Actinacidiphila sp. ITFR-21]|uniref:hypothetical protein n=1 Tax=Actinacidiphila sp. ITFR-21 TaxID=3075199 RepID=UPI00288B4580|nr:hypothetical protein [Streptomyces sp. ITFR-21]WNI15537.1 hypothetical protein RLT57_08375 [Streptomyces sp. ITFR-21]